MAHFNERVASEPTPTSASVLDGAPREGFTEYCAEFFKAAIPVDEVSAADARVL